MEGTGQSAALPPQETPAPQQAPGSISLELPQDLVIAAAQMLDRPPQMVLQALAQVIGQMVMRGLGVRVIPPPRQDGIVVARGMPPPPRLVVRP